MSSEQLPSCLLALSASTIGSYSYTGRPTRASLNSCLPKGNCLLLVQSEQPLLRQQTLAHRFSLASTTYMVRYIFVQGPSVGLLLLLFASGSWVDCTAFFIWVPSIHWTAPTYSRPSRLLARNPVCTYKGVQAESLLFLGHLYIMHCYLTPFPPLFFLCIYVSP